MLKNSIFLFSFCLLFVVHSCKRNEALEPNSHFDETSHYNSNYYSTDINGLVLDENENPISGATVAYQGLTTTTDDYGVYEFSNVKVGDIHNFIKITKPGYFDGCRTFRTINTATIFQKTILNKEMNSAVFMSAKGGNITSGNVNLSFSPESIVYEQTGETYDGEVVVSIRLIEPTEEQSAYQMPGDFSAEEDDQLVLLNSIGIISVELHSTQGDDLQIKDGQTVTMTTEIPLNLQENLPENLDLYHFDLLRGIWIQEGVLEKVGNILKSEVTHFSSWAYCGPKESIIFSGRLVDEIGNPLPSTSLHISTNKGWGNSGITNSDGSFSGRIPKGSSVRISIKGFDVRDCYGHDIYIDTALVGPYNSNTNIGNIVFKEPEATTPKSLLIQGTLLNCDGLNLKYGIITINNRIYQINNGEINVLLLYCDEKPQNLKIKAVDPTTKRVTNQIIDTKGQNTVHIGSLQLCDENDEYVELKCDNINFHQIFTENVGIDYIETYKSLIMFGNNNSTIQMHFFWPDSIIKSGTFDIERARIEVPIEGTLLREYYHEYVNNSSVSIREHPTKPFWIGEFNINVKSRHYDEMHTFNGNFQFNQ